MRPYRPVSSVSVILTAGVLLASPAQAEVSGAHTAVTAARAVVPAGVTSSWWTEVRDSLQATTEESPSSVDRSLSSPNWTAESDQKYADLGESVSGAGDVNGDGYDDVIVGAETYDNGQRDEGRAYAYHGSAAGLSVTANWTAESNQEGAIFGSSVAGAGDVNGDGYDDVVVGAWFASNGQAREGRAFAYYGSAGGLSLTPSWTAESNQGDAAFGFSVAGAGDVNGDGYDDVIVGAWSYRNGEDDEGRAYAYYGSGSGLSTTANWTAESNLERAQLGRSVAGAGDVNGDGYDDVIVGAPCAIPSLCTGVGQAFSFHGSATGLSIMANWTADSDQAHSRFGHSVSGAGDVNGDGYDDVIVGANLYNNGQYDEGRAFAYHGSASGLGITSSWTAEANQDFAELGYSVAGAGDVNGDGYDEVIVGSREYEEGQVGEGMIFVVCGSPLGLEISSCMRAQSNQFYGSFGHSVAGGGDVNGDGYDDVIWGAPDYDHGDKSEGVAVAKYGRPD